MSVIQIRKKGSITLPVELRKKYGLGEGDVLTLIDVGDGTIFLTPRASEVNRLSSRVAQMLADDGVILDDLLRTLDEEREHYYTEHYVNKQDLP